jgi:L-ascorbate metabolism protein UlaG (beta-lactamase superfamily)
MLNQPITRAPVCLTATVLVGSMLVAGTVHAQAVVKVTPIGSHSGELCARDRALLFEDPTGVRILYDPGQTTDETDPRLGEVHVVLLSHAHVDHIGGSRPSRGGGTCAAPAVGAANSNSNVATIAAAKSAAIMTANEVNIFLAGKVQAIRGVATPACLTGGLENEITVPTSSPCTATLGVGGVRTVRRGGAPASVRITGVQATHSNTIPPALIDPPGLPPGISAYGGVAEGFVVRFTNGLTAYLTGDTGMFADMGQVISRFYKPKLMVINMGPGGNGPNSIGPEDAGTVVLDLVRPTTVMPSHVGEQATSGGKVLGNTWTERFASQVRTGRRSFDSLSGFIEVVLPLSDIILTFDGEGRCIGCPR